jgi:hypothetical protein
MMGIMSKFIFEVPYTVHMDREGTIPPHHVVERKMRFEVHDRTLEAADRRFRDRLLQALHPDILAAERARTAGDDPGLHGSLAGGD